MKRTAHRTSQNNGSFDLWKHLDRTTLSDMGCQSAVKGEKPFHGLCNSTHYHKDRLGKQYNMPHPWHSAVVHSCREREQDESMLQLRGKDERIPINNCVYKKTWSRSDCKKIPNAQIGYISMSASISSSSHSLHLVSAHIQSVWV